MRRLIAFALALLCIANGIYMTYADTIRGEDILVSEPVTGTVFRSALGYLVVNVRDFDADDDELYVTITRKQQTLPKDLALNGKISVSMLQLVPPKSFENTKLAEYPIQHESLSTEKISDRAAKIIENYFVAMNRIDSYHRAKQILDTASKNKLELKTVQTYKDLVQDIEGDLSDLYVAREEYMQLFEEFVFSDVIRSPNYYVEIKNLPVGSYVIRFLDDDQKIIKEMPLNVVENVEVKTAPMKRTTTK